MRHEHPNANGHGKEGDIGRKHESPEGRGGNVRRALRNTPRSLVWQSARDGRKCNQGDRKHRGVKNEDRIRTPGIPKQAGGGRADHGRNGDHGPGEAHGTASLIRGHPIADYGERPGRQRGCPDTVYGARDQELLRRPHEGVAEDREGRDRQTEDDRAATAPSV